MKAVMAGLVVVMAFSAVAASGASAASWHVGGEELSLSAPLASATKMVEDVRLIESFGPEILCTGVELKGASIAAPAGGGVEHLVLTGCGVVSGACSLKGLAIESKPLSVAASLGGKSPEDVLSVKPASGKVFAEYQLVGPKCALAGTVQLTGKAKFVLPAGGEELVEQEVSMRTYASTGELVSGSSGVTLEGGLKAKLVSGKDWSFR
jgi:hypothetical protein